MRIGGIQLNRGAVTTLALGLAASLSVANLSVGELSPEDGFDSTVEAVEYSKGFSGPILDSEWYEVNFLLRFRPYEWEAGGKYYRSSRSLSFWYTVPMDGGLEKPIDDEMYGPRISMNLRIDNIVCESPFDSLDDLNVTEGPDCQHVLTQFITSLELKSIVEFTDGDGDSAYYPGSSDKTVSEVKVRDVFWHIPDVVALDLDYRELPLTYNKEVRPDGTEVYRGNMSEDEDAFSEVSGFRVILNTTSPPLLRITSYFFLTPRTISGVLLNPTETKISFHLKDFSLLSHDSMLALVMCMETGDLVEMTPDADNWMEVRSISDNAELFFRWSPTADVDGLERTVHAYVGTPYWMVEGPMLGSFLSLSYRQGYEIRHDPILGVSARPISAMEEDSDDSDLFSSTNMLSLGIGIVSFGTMVAVMEYTRKRRKIA